MVPVADLEKGSGRAGPPLFWVKKEEMTEGKKASKARKSRPDPPSLAQGLDPPATAVLVTSCGLQPVVTGFYENEMKTGAIIRDGDHKSWDARGPMICAILTSYIRADPLRVLGFRVDVVTLCDEMVRVSRFSCRLFTAIAGNKAKKKNQE